MTTLAELAGFKHHAVRSDGAKFLDGERDDSLPTPWLTVSGGRVTLAPGLYDELLVVKGEVSDDQIKAWAAMGAPFYDAAGNIVYEGAGGRIEMDKHGQRFIRAADQKTMIELDTETGDAKFAGDITGASGTFSGRIEAEEGYFRGDITGATGTFAGDLSAEGVVSYGNLNINYARVTSIVIPAPGWNHASLQIAQNKDEWNTGSWLGTFTWNETTSAPKIYTQTITITHQELSTLIGGGIIQYSPDGVNWSSEILLEALSFETPRVFSNIGGHSLAVGLISSSMSSHPSITTSQLIIRVFHLYGTEIDPPESFHIRVKRHAIG